MKFIPMLFSTPMVQALQAGTKKMTRRIVKFPKDFDGKEVFKNGSFGLKYSSNEFDGCVHRLSQKLEVGDVIWVRETFTGGFDDSQKYHYKADDKNLKIFAEMGWKWKPSLFMPKAACRIFLEITNRRVEQLQDITEIDAIDEGVEACIAGREKFGARAAGLRLFRNYERKDNSLTDYPYNGFDEAKVSFETLWQSINGEKSWDENPWVWCISFKQIEKPSAFITNE